MEASLDQVIQSLLELRERLPQPLQASPWEAVSQLLPMIYWESDSQGRLLELHGSCQALLESGAAQWLGCSIQSLWSVDDSEDPLNFHDRLIRRVSGGQDIWLRLAVAEKEDGTGYRGVMLDCTTQQRASLIGSVAKEQLTKLQLQTRYQEAFALNFGRELRTLMHRLLGLLSMLRQQPLSSAQQPLSSAQDDCAESIQGGLEYLMQLAQPLEESLGRGWGLEKQRVDFDLRETLAEVARWMAAEVAVKGIELQLSIAPSVPQRLSGDVVKLRQTLLLLLENAVKFSDGGDVCLEVTGHTEVHFCVRDSGRGMSSQKLHSLFRESLFEGDQESTGLGLKLARYLVEQMGGRIWADSLSEHGTSIFFTLPMEEAGLLPKPQAVAPKKVVPLLILLAEDDPISQKVTLRSLTRLGHKVDIVSSGLDVLDALQRSAYDVVLLDVEMPGLDGLETARQIHQRFNPTPYLIALTAGTSAADRRKVMLAGIHDYLAKPLRPQELADALTQAHSLS